jgi:glycerophosphoryl diester phosphodiesterase|tara:strand:- start:118 stop:870 length:753 start_codon:yes stop_codon:yes gene_type:complete
MVFLRFLLILIILTTTSLIYAQDVQVIGHRGAMGHAPENTITSVKKALMFDIDAIEIDVFRCLTGEIVVFHDKILSKLTNGKGNIENKTLTQLRKLKVMGTDSIPTLEEVISVINGKVNLNIELKGKNTAKGVLEIMQQSVLTGKWENHQLYVSSFDWDELREFRELTNQFRIAVLTDLNPIDAIPIAKELNAFAINPNHKKLSYNIVKEIQLNGFKVLTWTVNDTNRISKLISWGVDAIITDYPEYVIR